MNNRIVKESIINFERGLNPLDSMGIGLKNNPLKIGLLMDGQKYIGPDQAKYILEKLNKSSKISRYYEEEYYDDLWFFEETDSGEGEAYPLEEVKGKWIEYESKLYYITKN